MNLVQDSHRSPVSQKILYQKHFDIFQEQGLNPQVVPKFMEDDAPCVACSRCALGCPTGTKWTADKLLEGLDNVTVRRGFTAERLAPTDAN